MGWKAPEGNRDDHPGGLVGSPWRGGGHCPGCPHRVENASDRPEAAPELEYCQSRPMQGPTHAAQVKIRQWTVSSPEPWTYPVYDLSETSKISIPGPFWQPILCNPAKEIAHRPVKQSMFQTSLLDGAPSHRVPENPGSMNLRAPWGSDRFHVHIGSPRVLTRGEVGTGGDWPRLRVPRPDSTFSPNQSQAQNWKIVRKAFQNTGPWGLEPGWAPHLPGLRTVLPVAYLLLTVEVEKVIYWTSFSSLACS